MRMTGSDSHTRCPFSFFATASGIVHHLESISMSLHAMLITSPPRWAVNNLNLYTSATDGEAASSSAVHTFLISTSDKVRVRTFSGAGAFSRIHGVDSRIPDSIAQ